MLNGGIKSYCSFAYSAFACFRDGDVWVGVFPEGEEVLVGGKSANASGIRIPHPATFATVKRSPSPHPNVPTLPSSSSIQCRCGRESSETRWLPRGPVRLLSMPLRAHTSDRGRRN